LATPLEENQMTDNRKTKPNAKEERWDKITDAAAKFAAVPFGDEEAFERVLNQLEFQVDAVAALRIAALMSPERAEGLLKIAAAMVADLKAAGVDMRAYDDDYFDQFTPQQLQ
jgi:hypothetical protein